MRLEDKRFYPEDVGMVVTDKLIEHFPDVVDVNFTRAHRGGARRHRRGPDRDGRRCSTSSTGRSSGRSRRPSTRSSATRRSSTSCARCVPTEGREPGKLQVKLGRFGKFIGCPNYPECRYIRNMDGSERPEPEMLDETCPECGAQAAGARRPVRSVRRLQRLPGLQVHQEGPARDAPASRARSATRASWSRSAAASAPRSTAATATPTATSRSSNPPMKDHPCPECGSLLLPAPEVVRCWNCGAELDLDFNVTKDGDAEAEAAVRAAKAAAAAKRAPRKKKPAVEEEDRRQEEAGGEEEGPPPRRKPAAKKAPRGRRRRGRAGRTRRASGPVAQYRRRGRRAPRNPVGDPQGPPDEPGVLPAAGGDDRLVASGIGSDSSR